MTANSISFRAGFVSRFRAYAQDQEYGADPIVAGNKLAKECSRGGIERIEYFWLRDRERIGIILKLARSALDAIESEPRPRGPNGTDERSKPVKIKDGFSRRGFQKSDLEILDDTLRLLEKQLTGGDPSRQSTSLRPMFRRLLVLIGLAREIGSLEPPDGGGSPASSEGATSTQDQGGDRVRFPEELEARLQELSGHLDDIVRHAGPTLGPSASPTGPPSGG